MEWRRKIVAFFLTVVFGILSKYSCNHTLFSSPLFFSFNLDTRVCFCLFELFNFYGWESPSHWLIGHVSTTTKIESWFFKKEENRYVLNVYNREKCSFFFSFYFNQFPRRKTPPTCCFFLTQKTRKLLFFFFISIPFFFRG